MTQTIVLATFYFLWVSWMGESTSCFFLVAPHHHFPPSSSKTNQQFSTTSLHTEPVNVRDWNEGEGRKILEFLLQAEDGSFNPEGSLELDCQTESLLQESYNPDDGGCFVVAEQGNELVGVAGLIVGTPVEYQTSGSSVSTAQTTAAIRRCCSLTDLSVLTQMIQTLEKRAMEAEATLVIALAYPQVTQPNIVCIKPTPQLLEQLGYQKLAQQLPRVDAVQYGKNLSFQSRDTFAIDNRIAHKEEMDILGSLLLAGALGFLTAGIIAVAQFIGLDTTISANGKNWMMMSGSNREIDTINRGLGKPLSSEDLRQLLNDEKLQRTSLDGDLSSGTSSSSSSSSSRNRGGDREWKDLSVEEQREEMALLQIINGQDIRINNIGREREKL